MMEPGVPLQGWGAQVPIIMKSVIAKFGIEESAGLATVVASMA
jgi:hypothetical protein